MPAANTRLARRRGWCRRPCHVAAWQEVHYEVIARHPESELRRILAFLDLPWSEDVLAFHQRRDMVQSPTYAAVGRPVHQEAVGRWRRYADLFQPLKSQLDEVLRESEAVACA